MKTLLSILLTFCIGLGISSNTYAYRSPKPIQIRGTDPPDLVELNTVLEELWNITNGRYNLNVTTTNPDGTEQGDVGDMILFNDSGTYYLEINTTGSTIWRGVELKNVP